VAAAPPPDEHARAIKQIRQAEWYAEMEGDAVPMAVPGPNRWPRRSPVEVLELCRELLIRFENNSHNPVTSDGVTVNEAINLATSAVACLKCK
jgi:hypothetical protein